MKEPQIDNFPIDEAATFRPTKSYLLTESSSIISVTTTDLDLNPPPECLTPETLKQVQSATTTNSNSNSNPELQLRRPAWYKRTFTATKPTSETIVAEISGPLLDFGRWRLVFPPDSPHSTHTIDLRPTCAGSRADVLVQDGMVYFWEMADGRKLVRLWKVLGGKRNEVARYVTTSPRHWDGLLMVDAGEVDEVVAVVTCVATLHRSEAFRK